jgi:carbamate kinase
MGPKIESALGFLDGGGHEVLITTAEALATEDPATVGTRIVHD